MNQPLTRSPTRTRSRVRPQLVLYPGAGSDREHSSLIRIESEIAPTPCVRADFAYRRQGRRAPDRAPVLMQAVVDEVAALPARSRRPLVLGGRSMGGRICSIVVADGLVVAAGLVLISYPLHPPGKPDRLRVEHLSRITVPCLFVQGTSDAFGGPDELSEWTSTIPGDDTHVWVEGRGHDLRSSDQLIAEAVATWLETTIRRPAG